MNKFLFVAIILFTFFFNLQSYSICIKGKVVNAQNEPIEAATTLLLSKDSISIKGSIANKKGIFELYINNEGDFILSISAVGYEKSHISLSGISSDLNMGDIILTEKSFQLAEVSIVEKRNIRKVDREIIIPSKAQINASSDALNLLEKMSPNHLRINSIRETVTSGASGSVQFRINGMQTDIKEITSLLPQQVLRVEYYDHPGMQFGESRPDAVLNYIVKRSEGGGFLSANVKNAVNSGFGNDRISTKFNYKKSEFAFNYYLSYEQYRDRWIDEEAIYHYPNQNGNLKQITNGIKVPYGDMRHTFSVSYNRMEAEKYMFNAKINMPLQSWDNSFSNVKNFIQYPDNTIFSDANNKTKSYSPSFDLYYIHYLPKSQQLTFNIVGTYFNTNYERNYKETYGNECITNFSNQIKGKKYSAIGEIAYEKSWDKIVIDAGATYKRGYLQNHYTGSTEKSININNSYAYGYVQLSGEIKKLQYNLGIAGSFSRFNDSDNNHHYYSFLPNLQFRYSFSDEWSIAGKTGIELSDPTLSSLNNVDQQINTFLIQRGNPNLNSYKIYENQLGLDFKKGIFSLTLYAHYNYRNKPIMESIFFEKNQFINMLENQKAFKDLGAFADIRVEIIKDKLYLYWTNAISYQISQGQDYRHSRTFFLIGASIQYYYKNWDFQPLIPEKEICGEKLS